MIRAVDAKYGLQPFGAGNGNQMLAIYFEEDGKDTIDISKYDQKKDFIKIQELFYECAKNLYEEMKNIIHEKGLDDKWKSALEAVSLNYIGFVGNVVLNDDYFYPLCMVNELLTKDSIELQKAYIANGHEMAKIAAPHMTLVADAINQYVNRNPFEAFNFVVSRLLTRKTNSDGNVITINNSNSKEFYHPNSIMNVNNHTFGTFIFRPEVDEDLDLIEKYYLTYNFSHQGAVYVVPKSKDPEFINKCAKFALDHEFRLNLKLDTDEAVDFDR